MPYIAGVNYPQPKDVFPNANELHNLKEVTVEIGPIDVKAYPKECIDNALAFSDMYDVKVVRGYIGDLDEHEYVAQHYWNFDGLNYYDVTPFPKDFKFKYYLEETA